MSLTNHERRGDADAVFLSQSPWFLCTSLLYPQEVLLYRYLVRDDQDSTKYKFAL